MSPAYSESNRFSTNDDISLDRNQQIRNLRTAQPPIFLPNGAPDSERISNTILFTFSETNLVAGPGFTNNTRKITITPEKTVNRVAIAFGHEGWSILHPLEKVYPTEQPASIHHESNQGNPPVFFLYYRLDRQIQNQLLASGAPLEYRFIVDGVWMADPVNTATIRKINGSLVSLLDLHNAPPAPVISPEIIPAKLPSPSRLVSSNPETATMIVLAGTRQARSVILRWVGDPNQDVFVAGSFNQFDPYLTPLQSSGSDPRHPDRTVYSVELRLLPGQYYYHFVINGKNCLDSLNVRYGQNAEGITYSLLQVP